MRNADESSLHHFRALKSKKHLSCINKSSPFYLSTIRASSFLFRMFAFGCILHFNHEAFRLLIMRLLAL